MPILRCRGAMACTIALLLIGAPASLSAQSMDDAIERARVHVGPLGLSPSIAVTSVGIDSNVFNEFDDPKSDFKFALSPQLDTWLRAGRSRLHLSGRTDLWYFRHYASERSVDYAANARFEVRSARVLPWFTASLVDGRQRLGYEIDLRFRGVTQEFATGVDVRVVGKTRVGVSARHVNSDHEPVDYLGSNLREVLDRSTDALGLDLKYALTPLTTAVVSAERSRDRFQFMPSRNSDSSRIDAGFDLSEFALIGGSGRIGYRRFSGASGAMPDYAGVVASVSAKSTLLGRLQIELSTERDVNYSWELSHPYFLLTGATLTVTPQLTTKWYARARAGLHHLAYRAAVGLPEPQQDRVDRVELMGTGVGYRVSRDIRVGIDVDRERRESPVRLRAYEGFRTGISVTYGR